MASAGLHFHVWEEKGFPKEALFFPTELVISLDLAGSQVSASSGATCLSVTAGLSE